MRIVTAFVAFFIPLVLVELSEVSGSEPTSWDSPVFASQTQLGSRSGTHKKAVSGHLVNNYTLSNAPVYREGYPLYRYYISFLKDKAARISYEEEKLLNAGGTLCLGQASEKKTLEGGIDDNLVKFTFKNRIDGGSEMEFQPKIDKTFNIHDSKTKTFELTVRAKYNISIVAGTQCEQVETAVKGTMVTMYQTNPNATSQPTTGSQANETVTVPSQSTRLFPLPVAVVLFAFINVLRY